MKGDALRRKHKPTRRHQDKTTWQEWLPNSMNNSRRLLSISHLLCLQEKSSRPNRDTKQKWKRIQHLDKSTWLVKPSVKRSNREPWMKWLITSTWRGYTILRRNRGNSSYRLPMLLSNTLQWSQEKSLKQGKEKLSLEQMRRPQRQSTSRECKLPTRDRSTMLLKLKPSSSYLLNNQSKNICNACMRLKVCKLNKSKCKWRLQLQSHPQGKSSVNLLMKTKCVSFIRLSLSKTSTMLPSWAPKVRVAWKTTARIPTSTAGAPGIRCQTLLC